MVGTKCNKHAWASFFIIGELWLLFNCVSNCDTLQAKNNANSWIFSPAELIRSCHIFRLKTKNWALPLQQQSPPAERPSAHRPHCESVNVFVLLLSHPRREAWYRLRKQAARAIEFSKALWWGRGSICIASRKPKGVSNVLGAQREDE